MGALPLRPSSAASRWSLRTEGGCPNPWAQAGSLLDPEGPIEELGVGDTRVMAKRSLLQRDVGSRQRTPIVRN